jgi:hypothetical protein
LSDKKDLPEKREPSKSERTDEARQITNNLHYYASDIDALRRLAEVDPKLARRVVDQRDKESQRENVSYRFGVVGTFFLLALVLLTALTSLIHAGFLATLGMVVVILAAALLIRVVLTGEWSETTWFGGFVHSLARLLGSTKSGDDEDTDVDN